MELKNNYKSISKLIIASLDIEFFMIDQVSVYGSINEDLVEVKINLVLG